jgi:hypothetical protein
MVFLREQLTHFIGETVVEAKGRPRDHEPLLKEKIGKSARSCYFCDKCQRLSLPNNL